MNENTKNKPIVDKYKKVKETAVAILIDKNGKKKIIKL